MSLKSSPLAGVRLTQAIPARIPSSNGANLRPPFLIPRLPSLSSSTTPVSARLFSTLFRATPHQQYVYADSIPEFAIAETRKFRAKLLEKLSKDKEEFGDDLHMVVDVCSKIFSKFLHDEYGGPGTLLVEPFTEMFIELREKKLPGAKLAARASLLWSQNYVDRDWEIWNSKSCK